MRSSVERSGFWYGYGEIENILKTAGFILFFLKKLPSPLPQFRILREDEAIKMSNRLKMVGHFYKKQPENWLAKPPIFDDTANKKDCDIFFITVLCVSVTKKIPCCEGSS